MKRPFAFLIAVTLALAAGFAAASPVLIDPVTTHVVDQVQSAEAPSQVNFAVVRARAADVLPVTVAVTTANATALPSDSGQLQPMPTSASISMPSDRQMTLPQPDTPVWLSPALT